MCEPSQTKSAIIATAKLPKQFPTHRHDPEFWEAVGRTIATYGFLEEILGKAIFSFTATRKYPDSEIEDAYEKWLPILESALTDPLGRLIDLYGKHVREHPDATVEDLDGLIDSLRKASVIRNVLCHGSWRPPDEAGRSVPHFINRRKMAFETAVDISFLQQTQRHVAELACAIINTVTHMGWRFPGSDGPGSPITGNEV